MFQQHNKGFTFIELIITLSILSILSAYAVPNYLNFKQAQSMTSEINRLAATISFARNQSIILNQHVILCATNSFNECDGDSQWHLGWMVFIDKNRNRRFDHGDQMLLNENNMTAGLEAKSSIYRQHIRFNQVGFAAGTNLTIRFCDNRGSDYGKAIIINNAGRPRISQAISSCG
ncbi:GspH/FimT family pseudopilin [Marinicella sp. S1101]|uniref:GspH/FimT family pseudopilin n=1 Tax=Marinicella marina TaxID=2996016 RepID=UPI002260F762|nr:GspH/FimT family pseudopilin [Marinicella marina]MCX7553898.1 GspH/FimT family pseudopilin [Marinicella marina]MDJ1140390.1 GspH/FimT family pseudopilin [Marinicella marina]